MANEVVFERTIPVRYEVDVMVAGGGPSGMAAAVTAARQGKSVYLAEGHSCLGGMGTAALIPVFTGLTDGKNFVCAPFGKEVCNRLYDMGSHKPGAKRDVGTGGIWINPEGLKRIYDDMAVECKFQFTFHTQCIGVEMEGGTVKYVICQGKNGPFAVKAAIYIDCTGNGDLAAWAGAPYEKGDAEGFMQAPTLCGTWVNVEWDKIAKGGVSQNKYIHEAYAKKVLPYDDMHLPGLLRNGESRGGGNMGHLFGTDGTDERSLTKAMIDGRKMQVQYERYYKEFLKGYESMELGNTGSLLGVRETRRIFGDYVLVESDFVKKAIFEDEIGRYCWPVDLHANRPTREAYEDYAKKFKTQLRYKRGETYGIPYRVLTPRGLENLLVAGRCVSSDRSIQASIRTMPGSYITGQAAGMAAAVAVEGKTHTRGVNVKEVQRRLKGIGAYLPNA